MKSMFFMTTLIIFSLFISSCSGNNSSKQNVIAEVNGEKILIEDIYKNPAFGNMIDQYIQEKIIRQEFKARNLTANDDAIYEEWDNFVKMRGQGDEDKLLNELKSQGVSKSFILDQIKTQVMFKDIINHEFPTNLEDARKEFEGNLSANQKMYSGNVPEKAENPDTITFEDVSETVMKNMRNRVFSQEAQGFLETLKDEYNNQGWIINYVKPEEIDTLTKITPKGQIEEVHKEPVQTAPVKHSGDKKPDEEESEHSETVPEDEEEPDHSENTPESEEESEHG